MASSSVALASTQSSKVSPAVGWVAVMTVTSTGMLRALMSSGFWQDTVNEIVSE